MKLRRTITLSLLTLSIGCTPGAKGVSTAPTPLPDTPPSTFLFTTSDARLSRVIDVREGLTKAQVFKAATDYLTDKYSIDVSDPRAGFLMTPWQNTVVRGGGPDLRYRTRLIIRVSEDGKQASVRSEANWQRGEDWDIGYDARMLEDAIVELRTRVGKVALTPAPGTLKESRRSSSGS
ncbi:MAG TPA: hypothetical protein VGM82_20420 [Gemmatimonadaceae bacterium]|jgi:hypothetical protein